jgi:hypothetical protein
MSFRIGGYILVGVLMLSGCGSTTKSSAPTSSSTTPSSTTPSSTTQGTIAAVEQVTTLYVPTSAQPGSIRQYIEELTKINPTGFREWGSKDANGAERITLGADQEPLAADLVRRFGDRIRIQLGHLAYPLDPTSASTCPSADFTTENVGLSATIVLAESTVQPGDDFKGTVTITNTSDRTIAFEGGEPVIAFIRRHGELGVVATPESYIAGVGIGAKLKPGESQTISMVGGTASCDPKIGFALPPGTYEVITEVLGPSTSGPNAKLRLWAGPVELVVTSGP